MNKENLKAFVKNGSFVFDRFDDDGVMMRDVFNLAHAFGLWLKDKMVRDDSNVSVAVGTDMSKSSEEVKDVLLKSFTNDAFLVFDAQKTYPPALFRMTMMQNVTGCIYVSVDEKDSNVIIIEFLTRLGQLTDTDICCVIDLLTYSNKKIDHIVPDFKLDPNLKHFAEIIRQRICQSMNATDFSRPLRGFKLVIDTNDGIGDYVVDKILLPLGAEVVEVKGRDLVAKHCRNVSANAGIIFDYKLQRFSLVSREFGLITKEVFTYLMSQLLDAGENEEITILTDYKVSSKTKRMANEKFVCNFEVDLNKEHDLIDRQKYLNENGVNCPLAVFEDGRCIFSENYFLNDPVYTLFRLLIKIKVLHEDKKRLDDFIRPFYTKTGEWTVKNVSFDKAGYAKTVMTAVEGHCMKDSRWTTTNTENSILCRNDDFSFEITNVNDEYFNIGINCENTRVIYKILFQIYNYMKTFMSLNFDEIESIF